MMLTETVFKKKLILLWILLLLLFNFDTVAPNRLDDQYENLQHLMDERRAEFWNTFESDIPNSQTTETPVTYPDIDLNPRYPDIEPNPTRNFGNSAQNHDRNVPLSTKGPDSLSGEKLIEEKRNVDTFQKFYSEEINDDVLTGDDDSYGTYTDREDSPLIGYARSLNDDEKPQKIIRRKTKYSTNNEELLNNWTKMDEDSSEWRLLDDFNSSFEINDDVVTPFGGGGGGGEEKSTDQMTNQKIRNVKAMDRDQSAFDERRKSQTNSIYKRRTRLRENGGQEMRVSTQIAIPTSNSRKFRKNDDENSKGKKPGMGTMYTKWSKWSRCSRICQQTRRRRCRMPSVCGSALIKEHRRCIGWRCQREKFHLIQPDELGPNSDASDDFRPAPRADVRVLLNYNSMFYTKWSQWSACSRTCLTSRYRSCRYPLFCGNAVIREEGYCYVQNTPCEKWYLRHKLGPDNKNGFDENLNKVYYDVDRSPMQTQHNLTATKNETNKSSPPSQVIFGHNKFFTENSPISPEDSAHILNINIGSSHRFGPNRQRHRLNPNHNDVISKHEIVSKEANKTTINNIWLNRNKHMLNKQRENQKEDKYDSLSPSQTASKQSNLQRKPGYINNVYRHDGHREINIKEEFSDYHASLPIGRPTMLPTQCGKSKIRKTPWSLKIIGGREAPTDKWPWQVAILNRFKEVFCGGTLVADQWVLTAAHCLRKRLFARLAEHDLAIKEGHELEFRVIETVPHPLYDSTTVDNDVALLRLPEPIKIGIKMAPVCVPDQGAPLPVGQECTIIGWGKERHTHFFGTEVLNEAEVPIIDEEICKTVYNDYYITQNMFCAGYRRGKVDSCAGDSGGPLLCHRNGQWYIYGITSFGEGCGKRGKYGIYARVSNYRTWINDVIAAHGHRDRVISATHTRNTHSKSEQMHHRRHARHKDY